MLVLSRNVNEQIVIDGGRIVLTVCSIQPGRVKLGITAPQDTSVFRSEVLERNPEPKERAGKQDCSEST